MASHEVLALLIALALGALGGAIHYLTPPVETSKILRRVGAGAFVGALFGTPILLSIELTIGVLLIAAPPIIGMGYWAIDIVQQFLARMKENPTASDGGSPLRGNREGQFDLISLVALLTAIPSVIAAYLLFLLFVGGNGLILGSVLGAIGIITTKILIDRKKSSKENDGSRS